MSYTGKEEKSGGLRGMRRSRPICLAGVRAVVKPINPITRQDVRIWINGGGRRMYNVRYNGSIISH